MVDVDVCVFAYVGSTRSATYRSTARDARPLAVQSAYVTSLTPYAPRIVAPCPTTSLRASRRISRTSLASFAGVFAAASTRRMILSEDDVPAAAANDDDERRRPRARRETTTGDADRTESSRPYLSLSRVASLAHTRVASRCVTPRVISSLGPRSRETDETDETAATRARETGVIVLLLLVVSARLVVARPVVSRT